ncbi:MAG TPA: rod shape-determining protein MreD [Candidatus Binataceae bacterium]
MRLVFIYAIATLIALALETTIPHWLPIGMLMPNLVLILAVDLGMKHHGAIGALLAFGMGYAIDSFSGTHLGLNAFMLTLTYLVAYGLSRYLISTSTTIGVILVFVAATVTGLANSIGSAGLEAPGDAFAMLPGLALRAGVSALFTPWVFALTGFSKRAVGLRSRPVRE